MTIRRFVNKQGLTIGTLWFFLFISGLPIQNVSAKKSAFENKEAAQAFSLAATAFQADYNGPWHRDR